MFWLLTVLLFGSDPSQVAAGTLIFLTEQACNDKIADLKQSDPPDGVVAAQAWCAARSNPVTEKSAAVQP